MMLKLMLFRCGLLVIDFLVICEVELLVLVDW